MYDFCNITCLLTRLQEGIYYRGKPSIGNSFCIISLRSLGGSDVSKVGKTIARIWYHLNHLKQGVTADLRIDSKHRKIGNLTTLLAFGPKIFELPGSRLGKPSCFTDVWNFKQPTIGTPKPVLDGSSLHYSSVTRDNHLLNDHMLFQFIADNEFYTRRATVEVWKALYQIEKALGYSPLHITGFYSGFQRADKRNWFGFHDGVSNLKSRDRPHVISISPRSVNNRDRWTVNGSYLAFLRIALNLEKWEETAVPLQEMIVGRDKLTGCPLIRVDKNNKPRKDSRCPVPGTSEVIDPGNEYFRDHHSYGGMDQDRVLKMSHIARTRPVSQVHLNDKRPLRIFRQGFEFLVASGDPPGFMAGLNFVSFQNTPEKLYRVLSYRPLVDNKTILAMAIPSLEEFMSVVAGGIFFVPPFAQNELFPGAQIFFDPHEMRDQIIYNRNKFP